MSLAATLVLAGCGHHHHAYPVAAAPPPLQPPAAQPAPVGPAYGSIAPQPAVPSTAPANAAGPVASSSNDALFISTHKPIYSEEGTASWYGPPYNKRAGANGQIFDQDAMTAAHRTLPMGSLIVVTNERTGQSAVMRVTDRGPFVQGRVLDLSKASARAVGVYLPGTGRVRIDVYQTPRPMEPGGRWCVQIGAFEHAHKAEKLRDKLEDEYANSDVIDFKGPTGYWVRIRPHGDNREVAERIAQQLRPAEGDAYLVRLD